MIQPKMFNPWTGIPRHPSDIKSDPEGILMVPPETPLRAAVSGERVREAQQLIADCAPYLKEGETPAECIARNRKDVDGMLTMLAKERRAKESGTYWLIERGSPAEWWVGTHRISAADGGEWTRDSSKAQHFNEWGARKHAEELTQWGISGPLVATEHIDCAGPAVSGERERSPAQQMPATVTSGTGIAEVDSSILDRIESATSVKNTPVACSVVAGVSGERVREACARACEKRAEERFAEHGTTESGTGASYYGGRCEDEYNARDEEDEECAAAIRALPLTAIKGEQE